MHDGDGGRHGKRDGTPHGRAHWYAPGELTPEQRALYDAIVSGPRARGPQVFALTDDAGRLHGPFNAMLHNPRLGAAMLQVGSEIRYHGELSARAREIAILEVAALRRSEFEWYAHECLGRAAGLTEAELRALREGAAAPSLTVEETQVRALVRTLVVTEDVDDATFGAAHDLLGTNLLSELVTLVGYYRALALAMRFWRTPLPAGAQPVFDSLPSSSDEKATR